MIAVVLAAAGGCQTTSSKDLHTSGIRADIVVSAFASVASSVRVDLYPPGGYPFNHVKLDGGDALFVEAAGQRKPMGAGTSDYYQVGFATGAAETGFQVILDRASVDDIDAPGNSGALPAPFELGALGQSLVVTWSPSGTPDKMSLTLQGSCFEDLSIPVTGDPGTYALPALERDSPNPNATCQATLTVRRSRVGVVDPNLSSDSSFTLEQLRTATFTAAP